MISRTTPAITSIHCWSHHEPNPQRPPPQVALPLGPHQVPHPQRPNPQDPHIVRRRAGPRSSSWLVAARMRRAITPIPTATTGPTSKDPQGTGSSVIRIWGPERRRILCDLRSRRTRFARIPQGEVVLRGLVGLNGRQTGGCSGGQWFW